MRVFSAICFFVIILCTSCTKPSVQPSVPPEQASDEMTNSEVDECKGTEIMNMDVVQEYELFIDNADSFLNAPMSTYKHPALAAYENERIVEVNSKEDIHNIYKIYFKEVDRYIDPQSNKVLPFTLPIHAMFKVNSKDELGMVKSWFNDLRARVSTLEIKFSNNVSSEMHMDTIIDLRTNPETHNRVILSSIEDEPLDINKYHFLVSADVVQISNMVCEDCNQFSSKIEASVSKLFEAKRISINGTKFVKTLQEFRVRDQIYITPFSMDGIGGDIIFENCYFSNHELDRVISLGYGFDYAYLKNVGFYHNYSMRFGLPVEKKIILDHVLVSEGSVISSVDKSPEIEQKDCVLPEGAIRP